jgi:hypothetical protein
MYFLLGKHCRLLLFSASPAIRFTSAAPPCPLLSGLFNGVQCRELAKLTAKKGKLMCNTLSL